MWVVIIIIGIGAIVVGVVGLAALIWGWWFLIPLICLWIGGWVGLLFGIGLVAIIGVFVFGFRR